MTPITVACVFVKGPYPYTPEYVYRLERMVRKHLARPFRFVCLTDQPEALPGIETITIAPTLGSPESVGYWTKLRLFDPALGLTGRCVFLDLDVLVVDDLSPIVDWHAPFAPAEDELAAERPLVARDRFGRMVLHKVNSSVLAWTAGARTARIFTEWQPIVSESLSGDQDWIALVEPFAYAMPSWWFPRLSRIDPPAWPKDAKVILCKKPKNHEAVQRYPWFDAAWGGKEAA